MIKTIKVILQIVSVFLPILHFIFNVETADSTTAILNVFIGVGIAFFIEWVWGFCKYIKS